MNADFWNMGGYGVYIWGSYAAAMAVYAWNLWAPRARRTEILKQLTEDQDL